MYFFSRKCQTDITVVKHLLQQHRVKVITSADNEDVQHVRVRRSHVFSDALRQFSREPFDCSKLLRIRFIGEAAVDDGGPRREFFHFLLQEMFKSSYFGGFPEHVVLIHDVEALSKNIYFIFGKMIATCLVQGGEPPTCFASAVADYLVFGRVESPVDLDDIPDFEVRNCLHKVSMLFITFIFTMYTSHCLFSLPLSYYSVTITYIIVYFFAII